jgi:hypothetical protein
MENANILEESGAENSTRIVGPTHGSMKSRQEVSQRRRLIVWYGCSRGLVQRHCHCFSVREDDRGSAGGSIAWLRDAANDSFDGTSSTTDFHTNDCSLLDRHARGCHRLLPQLY